MPIPQPPKNTTTLQKSKWSPLWPALTARKQHQTACEHPDPESNETSQEMTLLAHIVNEPRDTAQEMVVPHATALVLQLHVLISLRLQFRGSHYCQRSLLGPDLMRKLVWSNTG